MPPSGWHPVSHHAPLQGARAYEEEEEDKDAGGEGHISGRCAANNHVEMINATN